MKHFPLASVLFFSLISILFASRPEVTVSIVPLETFVKKIAKDAVNINVMVQPGNSPAVYEPKPSQMRALSRSKLYFSVGVPFEKVWLQRFARQNPDMKIIDTAEGIHKLPMAAHHHHDGEDHDEHGDHDEEASLDPHIWTSPLLVKTMAATILEALSELMPEKNAYFEANYRTFVTEIEQTDALIKSVLAEKKGSVFMVFHPSWGYFADTYGLRQLPIEIEGKEPKPSELGEFIREIKLKQAGVIFVQPEFSQKAAQTIAKEAGVRVHSISSLSPEWSATLIDFARAISGDTK